MDEITITRAITESYTRELLDFLEVDVAIAGAGPSGPVAAYYLAKKGRKTVIYERKRSAGGGMWGGRHDVQPDCGPGKSQGDSG